MEDNTNIDLASAIALWGILASAVVAFSIARVAWGTRGHERLAREKVVLCTLNEARDRVLRKQYVTKAEASKITPICGGEILDLEAVYNGLMVRGRYLLVSESAVVEGLKKYAPDDLLNGLIKERTSA